MVGIALTNECNLNCIHCSNDSREPLPNELTTQEVFNIVDELAEIGTMIIGYTGGEPFCRDDLFEILRYTEQRGMRIILTTNGTMIQHREAKMLKDLGVMLVRVSIDGAREGSHDKFRGVPGTFKRATNAVRELVDAGVRTTVLTTVSHFNLREIADIMDLSVELRADVFGTTLFIPLGRGERVKELMLNPYEVRDLYTMLHSKKKELQGKINIKVDAPLTFLIDEQHISDVTRMCQAGIWSLEITPDGYAQPCYIFRNIKVENVRERSVQEIWLESEIFNKVRDRSLLTGKCKRCKYLNTCGGGCRGMAYMLTGNRFAPDPLCWYEPGEDKE